MNYCVYCYVFDDGMTYVGLTKQCPRRRNNGHHQKKHGKLASPVARYAERTGLRFPDMLVLYEGLEPREAQSTEHIIRSAIDEAKCLNKMPTGVGIGSLGVPIGRKTQEQLKEQNRIKCKRFRDKNKDYFIEYRKSHREYYKQYHKEYQKHYRHGYYEKTKDKQRIKDIVSWPEKCRRRKNRRVLQRFMRLTEIKLLTYDFESGYKPSRQF